MQAGRQEMLQKESLEKEGRQVEGEARSQEPGDGDRALVSVKLGRGLGAWCRVWMMTQRTGESVPIPEWC